MRLALLVPFIAVVAAGCATLDTLETRAMERELRAAGFSIETTDASTLVTIPTRKIVRDVRDGKPVYLYRDPSVCDCVYVGGDREYQRYRQLELAKETADPEAATEPRCGWPPGTVGNCPQEDFPNE
jgi:hypothetical protein